MRNTITVTVPAEVRSELDGFAGRHGLTHGEVVCDAVREYLLFHRSRGLRARMMAEARGQGLLTDDGVFEQIS